MKKNDIEDLLLCECSSCEHQLIVRYDRDESEVYVSVHLAASKSFFARVWHALKYVFGHKSKYGAFDEVILRPEDAGKLQRAAGFLQRARAHHAGK